MTFECAVTAAVASYEDNRKRKNHFVEIGVQVNPIAS